MKRRILLFALAAPYLAVADERAISFGNGKVEVQLPDTVRVSSNKDQTLVAVFGATGDHKLELTLHEELMAASAADAAEQFVRQQAQRKGRRLQEVPGKALFLEPGGEFTEDGKTFRTMHLQVGFGKSLVIITITAPVTQPISPALTEFLGQPMNAMIGSLRRN